MPSDTAAPAAIDLERYPLDRLDDAPGRALVERCRADLARCGLTQLPGFLRPEAVAAWAREALRCGEGAFHMEHMFRYGEGMPYLADESALPPDDPRRYRIRTALRFVPGDEVPRDSALWALYAWPPMLELVRQALGREALYRAKDALNSVNYLVYRDGDEQDWHFDEHDFSVTILLRAPAGAGFEFVPDLRSERGEDLAGMREAQAGTHPRLVRPRAEPGTLSLFEGRYHYHRATRVHGERERLLALLQFDDRPVDPDPEGNRELNRLFYGRPE
jgi:hypothetical protein